MTTTLPPLRRVASVALAALVACALLAGPAGAEAITYVHEEKSAYEHQLAAGEIASAKINKFVRHLDLALKNGQHFVYVYPPKDEPTAQKALEAKGVGVEVLTPALARTEAKKTVHHKLRYIAGGIVIVVVLIVVAVLVIDRRRKRLAE